MPQTILVTGAAGFIGFHVAQRYLEQGDRVIGLDNVNEYYDVQLKHDRLDILRRHSDFQLIQADIADRAAVAAIFAEHRFDVVINLAAQAGVRHSLTHPQDYIDANLTGFGNILEGCRHQQVGHLVFASSSSVYGANTTMPFSVRHNVDHPLSLYAATKKANELMAHSYANLYQLPCTGLRFFSVYGPWGRPDMALFLFTKAILDGEPIKVFNEGNMLRDFTYIDDIVEGIIRVAARPAAPDPDWSGDSPDPSRSFAPFRVYNIGNNNPVKLGYFIECIERALGMQAQKELLPMQPGDVPAAYADVADLMADTGFKPATSIDDGINAFVTWYRDYYGV